jgi:2,3-dihydroxybenzoate decarboxylase
MFSTDYPFESMQEAAGWFDASLLSYNDKLKVGRGNAERVFGIALAPHPISGEAHVHR